MQKHVTYIVSDINKAIAFEWIVEHISSNVKLSFILLNNNETFLERFLIEKSILYIRIPVKGKKTFPKAIKSCIKFLKRNNSDVIHCHLRNANIIGLIAGKVAKVPKRIYTRHHSTFHHEFHPKAVKIDKLCNKMATNIIAISENVRDVLTTKEDVSSDKIQLIHHGFNLNSFNDISKKQVNKLRNKYSLNDSSSPVIGVVARYINWKGHIYIINAFKNLLTKYPNAHIIFANASGPDYEKIHQTIIDLIPKANFTEIKFENDLFALYKLFDIYIHAPINSEVEAFGQTYIESLASEIPMICTLSGVGNEFVVDKKNALVIDYESSEEIEHAIHTMINNVDLKKSLIENGKSSVTRFALPSFIEKLNNLYLND